MIHKKLPNKRGGLVHVSRSVTRVNPTNAGSDCGGGGWIRLPRASRCVYVYPHTLAGVIRGYCMLFPQTVYRSLWNWSVCHVGIIFHFVSPSHITSLNRTVLASGSTFSQFKSVKLQQSCFKQSTVLFKGS